MKQELEQDKNLLLKDLCARLPYGVIMGNKTLVNTHYVLRGADIDEAEFDDEFDDIPYLRTMSSMTEEEKKEYELLANHCIVTSIGFVHIESQILIDWLNAHHFDYRGLIEKGLALEAPEGMYKTE